MPDLCLVGEPTNPGALGDAVKVGRRGSLNATVTVHGTQGHAAYPERADNPVHRLLRALHVTEVARVLHDDALAGCDDRQRIAFGDELGEVHVDDLLVHDDVAIVELHSEAVAKNGFRFDNHYCWVCYFGNDTIVRVRAYLDSVMVVRLFEQNPIG